MSKVEYERDLRGTFVCSVCKQPLEMTIKGRHKTLGIFVPTWGPEPCHNPECPENSGEAKHKHLKNH